MTFTDFVNGFLGALTIAADVISVGLILAFFVPQIRSSSFARFFSDKAVLVAFVAALVATLGSLTYSDVIGYDPCKLCWFQRIFMYPQVILLGFALWRKEPFIKVYSATLSTIGGLIALFHYIGQLGVNPLGLGCLAVGYSASCAKNFVLIFGYVTIPMMALSAFALMALSISLSLKKEKTLP